MRKFQDCIRKGIGQMALSFLLLLMPIASALPCCCHAAGAAILSAGETATSCCQTGLLTLRISKGSCCAAERDHGPAVAGGSNDCECCPDSADFSLSDLSRDRTGDEIRIDGSLHLGIVDEIGRDQDLGRVASLRGDDHVVTHNRRQADLCVWRN